MVNNNNNKGIKINEIKGKRKIKIKIIIKQK